MCGIVGYIGQKDALPILLDGLKRLEYRGYDSAGVAYLYDGKVKAIKASGKLDKLSRLIANHPDKANIGIAHTRWATHGEPNDTNAHPHTDCTGRIAVVHNGIIENYRALRQYLADKGHVFRTETDTEVIAHLIEDIYGDGSLMPFWKAVREALREVEGTYGIAVLFEGEPNKIFAARHGSPLLVGIGDGENIVASDASAVIRHTDRVIYLDEGTLATIKANSVKMCTLDAEDVTPQVERLSLTLSEIEKGGFSHFMLKEICEQPDTLRNAIRGRLNPDDGTARLNGLNKYFDLLKNVDRILITACGTSWHAALIGEYLIEELARIPVEVDYASEFRYRGPIFRDGDALFVISQSGETADTLAALREAKRQGVAVFGIVNVVGSTIARETDAGVYIHAGPEIGVASTKAFTSQLMVLSEIALLLARMHGLSSVRGRKIARELLAVPDKVERVLSRERELGEIEAIARDYCDFKNFLYLGRGINYPVALEGALKLKEISYVHAEGYPAAEMKHGPIALIDNDMPVVFIATEDPLYDKIVSNIEEVRARGGRILALATEGDEKIAELAQHVIYLPQADPLVMPMIAAIPLQLLAYRIAVLRGTDVDQPRNLAKSVTVE
ncbi:MAG TPA: glutamine--fructose-6-phosphate transaminase (isomerizing) [candidate division Zixibacteria bacterium]|nr:glutamine--fructose-6-phosphate transaminase (isomerizing) [candidate division Zixibacteria bacterium]